MGQRVVTWGVVLAALGALVTLGVVGPAAAPAQEPVIRFGAPLGLSGNFARFGKVTKDGYDLYLDAVAAQGGIDVGGTKYKVEIKYYDDKSDFPTSARLTEKLLTEDKVHFVIGPLSSGASFAASTVAERYKVPMIAPIASAPRLYQRGYKYLFGLLALTPDQYETTFEMAVALKPAPKTVAYLAEDSLFPLSAARDARASAEKRGLSTVYFEKYPTRTQDFAPMLTILKQRQPDILVVTGELEQTILVAKQMKEQDLNVRMLVMTAGPTHAEFVTSLGKDSAFIVSPAQWTRTFPYTGKVFRTAEDFTQRFEKKYGYTPGYESAAAADALILYQEAIQKAGSLEPEKVRQAITGLETTTFFGPVKYDANGVNVKAVMAVIQIQDGKMKTIYPKEVAESQVMYPMPRWRER